MLNEVNRALNGESLKVEHYPIRLKKAAGPSSVDSEEGEDEVEDEMPATVAPKTRSTKSSTTTPTPKCAKGPNSTAHVADTVAQVKKNAIPVGVPSFWYVLRHAVGNLPGTIFVVSRDSVQVGGQTSVALAVSTVVPTSRMTYREKFVALHGRFGQTPMIRRLTKLILKPCVTWRGFRFPKLRANIGSRKCSLRKSLPAAVAMRAMKRMKQTNHHRRFAVQADLSYSGEFYVDALALLSPHLDKDLALFRTPEIGDWLGDIYVLSFEIFIKIAAFESDIREKLNDMCEQAKKNQIRQQ